MNRAPKNNKGITLVEVIVYIAVFSVSITALVSYILMINVVNIKNNVISNLENESRFIFSVLEKNIINSENIIYPTENIASSTLILDMPEANPNLKFYIDNRKFYVEEIGASSYALTSDRIDINQLEFFASVSDKTNIKISFTLEARNGTSKEFEYTKKYYNSFTTR
ncbi:MAG: prepilin-type N-terminal cleavage/methylation domain-containing protein [Patescibacteria group bacterium]|jgi:type II secretory pathway pseudopilin PulG|nr:prepilin-type N-terminal cleavage/methylation domain-containing protein [Patescibacteria group bacterium]